MKILIVSIIVLFSFSAGAEDSKSIDVKGGFFEKGSVSRGMFGDFEQESMPTDGTRNGKNSYNIVPTIGVEPTSDQLPKTETAPEIDQNINPHIDKPNDSFSTDSEQNNNSTEDESTASKAQDVYGRITPGTSSEATTNTKNAIDKLKDLIKGQAVESNPNRRTKTLEGTSF